MKPSKFSVFFALPVSLFSVVLGLASLGLALRYAASQNLLPAILSDILLLAAFVVYSVLLVAYIGKWFKNRHLALDELRHLLLCCFISLIFITTMLLAMALAPYQPQIALTVLIIATVAQLLFSAYRTAGLWRGLHQFSATTPLVYLPSVAANFVSASGLASMGYVDVAWLFFGAALLSWLSFEPAILANFRNSEPMAAPARPIMGIQLAPAFVAGNTYLALNGGKVDVILLLLTGYGILQFFYLLRLLPWIFAAGVKTNMWGFSFGLGSMAAIGAHLIFAKGALPILGAVMLVVGSVLIGLMAMVSLFALLRWLFLPPKPASV